MMLKNKNGLRIFSESAPPECILRPVATADLLRATVDFFDENFKGAVTTDISPLTAGYAKISAEGVAYFFKLLLNSVFGDTTVHISLYADNRSLIISSSWAPHRKMSDSDLSELKTFAKLSGFDFDFVDTGSDCRISLTSAVSATVALKIYAVSFSRVHSAFIKVFFL